MKDLFTCLPWHSPSPLIYSLLSTSQFTSIINASSYHAPPTSFLMLFSPTVCLRKLLIGQIWESNTSCSVLFNQVQREASKLAKMLSSHQHWQRCLPLRQLSYPGGKYCSRADSCSSCQNKQVKILSMQQKWNKQDKIEFHSQIQIF